MTGWTRLKTLAWVIAIGVAAYLSPNIISNSDVFEKHNLPMRKGRACQAEQFRQKFYIRSDNALPAPFHHIFLPIYSTHNLSSVNLNIKTAIISIHGFGRAAETYFCETVRATSHQPGTVVIVPWFSDSQMSGEEWGPDDDITYPDSASLYWSTSNWLKGANASPKPAMYSSSFHSIDALVQALQNPSRFPGLARIVLAGYSAGAQLLNRHAWASSTLYPVDLVRYVISDASSYLYFDNIRPDPSCTPLHDTGPNHACTSYGAVHEDMAATCPGYDNWKYGVGSLPPTGYSYLEKYLSNETAVKESTSLYRLKNILYLLGDADVCNCNAKDFKNRADNCYPSLREWEVACSPNEFGGEGCCDTYPDSTNNHLSLSCESMIQGSNRFQRGLLYMQYLRLFWSAQHEYSPQFSIITGMEHNLTAFFISKEFQDFAFPRRRVRNESFGTNRR